MNQLPTYDFLMLQLKLKGIWQRRSLGQHFLIDHELLCKIADETASGPQTLAIEIGPGPGTLTTELAARAGAVLAIEFDRRLTPVHQDSFTGAPTVEFVYADAMKVDLVAAAQEAMQRRGLSEAVLTGNLPFQITSPLLFGQCGPEAPWRRMTVMIQREVADRICARPSTKNYGILSVKLAYWWRVTQRFEVPARKFFPQPKVEATVLVFERPNLSDPALAPSVEEWPGLSAFIDAAFGQRRKMLINSLSGCWKKFPGKEKVLEALEALAIPIKTRAEDLAPQDLLRLSRRLQ